jgi:predicted DNA-binding protein with PD1-like motif
MAEWRKDAGAVILRFEEGEEIVSGLKAVCAAAGITGGIVSAIGAVRDAEISVFNPATKTYADTRVKENCEIVSLAGFASVMDGKAWPHLHIALAGPDFRVVGGHLKKAIASPTCEMAITITGKLERKKDAKSGLALLELGKQAGPRF